MKARSGCVLAVWQWAFEAPPVLNDVTHKQLGAENMSAVTARPGFARPFVPESPQ